MDESFSAAGSKFPEGEPNDEWTVEELLYYSLDQYQNRAIEQTNQSIASLRRQCEKECEDIMEMHSMAVDMANKNNNDGGADEENLNPQSDNAATSATGSTDKGVAKSSATSVAGGTKSSSAIEIQVIVGPHSSSKFLLRPKPGTPCMIGRSKGKKFVKGGISLHKDQEVSTTHGKFIVEGGGLASFSSSSEGEMAATGGLKFYYIDLGSTNGSVHDGRQLEANERLLLHDGMELKVGNSVLKVVLG